MSDPIDLLQVKIDKAKSELPEATREAINAVDWKAVIFTMRESKGYSFEQLGNLELETELMLVGLVSIEDYPKELERRMGLSRAQVDTLVEEMNQKVFSRIREELIKNAERKVIFANKSKVSEKNEDLEPLHVDEIKTEEMNVLHESGIHIMPDGNAPIIASIKAKQSFKMPEIKPVPSSPVLAQKFAGTVQAQTVKTEHTDVVAKTETPPVNKAYPNGGDPYRLAPNE